MDAEQAHDFALKLFRTTGPVIPASSQADLLEYSLPKSGLRLKSPVGLAAGFDKNARVAAHTHKFGFGFAECGTVTPKAQTGNPKPRVFRLKEDKGVINRMGFPSDGLEKFVSNLKKAKNARVPIGANVGANKDSEDRIGDYETGIEAVYPHAQYITINISSPNTPGLRGLQDKGALEELLTRCGEAMDRAHEATETEGKGRKPAFLKVAPDLDDRTIHDIIAVVRGSGRWLSGLIVSNTTLERPDTLQSEHKSETGGLSGAPLFDLSTEVLRVFSRELKGEFDLIGAGGIASGADAYAKIRAGAHAVQLYSALVYHGPGLVAEINRDLAERLYADGFTSVEQAVGADFR
ncbi:quinone-dependent dihydroorotate dehydrogenase [Henriciella marina]|uniref:Dihydroorotate dehydrogenase (quinone) n=2 Tax=Henriciella marina TaxID=453851 RepID=A0ABT4LRG6_9PROT|nr:quinone-dependent dihydroorotate dehydrogenase [Henriciella marina]MCZ4296717.1 quinone-dependent dihydroorotate dehydrogenase [Henriciella marina]